MFLCHLISIKHKYEITNQKTINQSSSGLITLVTDVSTAKEAIMQIHTKYIPNKMQDSTFADPDFFIFLVLFSKKITFSLKTETTLLKELLWMRQDLMVLR